MTRVAAFLAAATLFAAPSVAGTYVAKPVEGPASNRIVGKNIAWTCAEGICRGSTDLSRPLVLCQDLAKRTGRIETFSADGAPLSADQLAKCNASARDDAQTELARKN